MYFKIKDKEKITNYYKKNGYVIIRNFFLKKRIHSIKKKILKNIKLKKNKFLRKELIKPTKIYVEEILNLINKKLINGCANITGGGIEDNIKRILPSNLCASIDLKKIKPNSIFKWIHDQGVNEKEMIKTFNCGVGFSIIINSKKLKKIKKYFSKNFQPYVIGKIINGKKNVDLNGKIKW